MINIASESYKSAWEELLTLSGYFPGFQTSWWPLMARTTSPLFLYVPFFSQTREGPTLSSAWSDPVCHLLCQPNHKLDKWSPLNDAHSYQVIRILNCTALWPCLKERVESRISGIIQSPSDDNELWEVTLSKWDPKGRQDRCTNVMCGVWHLAGCRTAAKPFTKE